MEKEEEKAGYSNPELSFAYVYVCMYWNDFKAFTGLIYVLDTYHQSV